MYRYILNKPSLFPLARENHWSLSYSLSRCTMFSRIHVYKQTFISLSSGCEAPGEVVSMGDGFGATSGFFLSFLSFFRTRYVVISASVTVMVGKNWSSCCVVTLIIHCWIMGLTPRVMYCWRYRCLYIFFMQRVECLTLFTIILVHGCLLIYNRKVYRIMI